MAIYRVTCAGELYGSERWANVFHVDAASPSVLGDVATAFDLVYSSAATGGGMSWLNPCRGNASGIVGVHMSTISIQALVDPAPPVITAANHNGGQNTAGGLPVDVALVVSWTTARAGKSFRGRTYLPPWHENQNDDSTPSFPIPLAASVSGVAINADKLIGDLTDAEAPLVVWSRKLGSAEPITGGYIDTNWDTQRRRSKQEPATRTVFPA